MNKRSASYGWLFLACAHYLELPPQMNKDIGLVPQHIVIILDHAAQ